MLFRSKRRYPRALAIAALGVVSIAVGEFCVCPLADSCETRRHLLLFHLFTDFSIFLAVLWALQQTHRSVSEPADADAGS